MEKPGSAEARKRTQARPEDPTAQLSATQPTVGWKLINFILQNPLKRFSPWVKFL
jgi:hypothetical protein